MLPGMIPKIAFTGTHRSFASDKHVGTVVIFASNVVVVTVDRLEFSRERTNLAQSSHGSNDFGHHQITICTGIVLRPFDRFEIVIEVAGAFREVRQIDIRQIDGVLAHILTRQLDEVGAHATSNAARTAVQHEPDIFRFIQTDLNEVVAGAERAEWLRSFPRFSFGCLARILS